jgi:type II secretory pathway pseudopilin PulG
MADRTRAGAQDLGAGNDGGFTVIESLTAAAILLVIAVAVVTTLITTSSWYAKARARTEATAVATEVMTQILSRSSEEITVTTTGVWPAKIPAETTVTSGYGPFAVRISIVPTTNGYLPADKLIKVVTVTAYPASQPPLDPPVSIVRFASGWQTYNPASVSHEITVVAQIQIGGVDVQQSGARVQLLDATLIPSGLLPPDPAFVPGPAYLTEVSGGFALTENGIATFRNIREGEYYLTVDYRFGSDVRPRYYPTLIYPTDTVARTYLIECANSASPAVLRVGAYIGDGVRVIESSWNYPMAPYTHVAGLKVYARPVLGGETDRFGTRYPDVSRWPGGQTVTRNGESISGVYSGTVNAFGVAVIEIPWTLRTGQPWEIWCYTSTTAPGVPTVKQVTVPGSWSTEYSMPDVPTVSGAVTESDRPNVAQFTFPSGTTQSNP